jgi:MFS family permease
MISWGRAADRIGRKPVLVFSLVGVAIATAIFGLSKSIPQMVLFRCCAGVFAGTIVYVALSLNHSNVTNGLAGLLGRCSRSTARKRHKPGPLAFLLSVAIWASSWGR